MARGFESKDVEFQQAEASRPATRGRTLSPAERDKAEKRLTAELALAKARAECDAATNARHRTMLEAAIRSLEHRLDELSYPMS
jgi:hypothetical protein